MFLSRSAVVLLIVLAGVLAGCRSSPAPRVLEATSTVYVVKRSWHIDIGFPAGELRQPLLRVSGQYPSAEYLEFGFGDEHYMLTKNKRTATLLSALWPGPGLILMTGLRATPEQAFGSSNVIRVSVTPAQSLRIQTFIENTLAQHDATNDALKPLADGPYSGSVFYAAAAKYSAFHTCNTWAAEALQSAPLPIDSTGVEFSGQVWRQVQRISQPN